VDCDAPAWRLRFELEADADEDRMIQGGAGGEGRIAKKKETNRKQMK
jgi:hypothetical protein